MQKVIKKTVVTVTMAPIRIFRPTSKKEQESKVVGSLIWIGFKKLVIERFILEYQKLCEDMNLVQIRKTRSFMAYVCGFNAQMNATSKMDEFVKKCIFLGGLQKWMVDALFKFLELPKHMAGIIKIAKKIEVDGPERKLGSPLNKVTQVRMSFKAKNIGSLG